MRKTKKERPRPAEGPVRRPEDIDPAGTGGPYGHTVPEAEEERAEDARREEPKKKR